MDDFVCEFFITSWHEPELSWILLIPVSLLPVQSNSSVLISPHQLELPCTRTLPPQFTTVPHFEAFCRATPAFRHWLTYLARFSHRAWPCVPFYAALSAVLAFALLAGTPIIFSLTITVKSKLCNLNHYTPRSYDQNTKLWNILFSVWDLNNVTVMFQIIF